MPGVGSSVPAMRLKSKHKIKFILDAADLHSFVRPKFLIEKSFNNAEKILAITDSIKNDLVNRGIDKNKIHIIPNGADLELFNSKNYDKKSIETIRNSFESDNVVMFCGSLQDLNILINAASIVTKKIPDVKFVIIGDRRDPRHSKSYWENKVQKIGLKSNFIFLGKKPRAEIPKYLLSSDVCVDCFPDDPYYAAAHPIKILEYGACEKPVVATNVTETKKIVKHGEFGYVSDPKKHEDYAEFLINVLSSKDKSKKMGEQFRIFIQENFDWIEIAKKLEQTLMD